MGIFRRRYNLKGTLTFARNTKQDGQMVSAHNQSYDVEIFPDGTLSYLMKINEMPVGGMPPTKMQATCVKDVLLTATRESEVVTVGVARQPSISTVVGHYKPVANFSNYR